MEGLSLRNHEEADSRIFTHAHHLARQKATSLLMKACDTDILVIAINAFETLQAAGLETMWVECGQGQSIRRFLIHDFGKESWSREI